MRNFKIYIFLLFILSSCNFHLEKRVYSGGYYFEWNRYKPDKNQSNDSILLAKYEDKKEKPSLDSFQKISAPAKIEFLSEEQTKTITCQEMTPEPVIHTSNKKSLVIKKKIKTEKKQDFKSPNYSNSELNRLFAKAFILTLLILVCIFILTALAFSVANPTFLVILAILADIFLLSKYISHLRFLIYKENRSPSVKSIRILKTIFLIVTIIATVGIGILIAWEPSRFAYLILALAFAIVMITGLLIIRSKMKKAKANTQKPRLSEEEIGTRKAMVNLGILTGIFLPIIIILLLSLLN